MDLHFVLSASSLTALSLSFDFFAPIIVLHLTPNDSNVFLNINHIILLDHLHVKPGIKNIKALSQYSIWIILTFFSCAWKKFKVSHSKNFHHFSKFASDRFTQSKSLFSNLLEISLANFTLYDPFNMGHMEETYVADKSSFYSNIFFCAVFMHL